MANTQKNQPWWRIALTLLVALAAFFGMPIMIEAYALELREVSAMMAEMLLRATHLEVTRHGTILSLQGMVFDIIPACSGSEMIRTLVFTSILWNGIHPRIRLPNKIIALVLAVVVAVLANSIRLTLLLWASYQRGEVIAEGGLHSLIGLLAFTLAVAGYFIIAESLADPLEGQPASKQQTRSANNVLPLTIALMVLSYLPVLSACLEAWKGTVYNQYDTFGYIFFLAGLVGWCWFWQGTELDTRRVRQGAILYGLASIAAVLSQIPGPNYYLLGVTLMLSFFALSLAYRNLSFALQAWPFQFVMFLSFPKVSEIINFFLGTNGIIVPLLGKLVLSVFAAAIFIKYCMPIKRKTVHAALSPGWPASMAASAALGLLAMLYIVRVEPPRSRDSIVVLPYILGDQLTWEGTDILDEETYSFYQRSNIISRNYVQGEKQVGVMIVPSHGNRKAIHTPEYCQIGLGWKPTTSESIEFLNADARKSKARKLLLIHEEQGIERTFVYWFGDEQGNGIDNYPEFLITDTWRKLFGKQTNWNLYVVWSDESSDSIDEFLPCLYLEN
ncbi:MAG: exosortase-associated EpsI family protein [Rubritalea sp.]|uniref:exosortase-associated EpsI family protein n=1 Tax=Rubritalea sp. TaxID=2109375 RepID=UPI00324238AD